MSTATPAAKPSAQRFLASDWRPFERGAMKGWFTVTLPSRLFFARGIERPLLDWHAVEAFQKSQRHGELYQSG
jgi:hypothetical protein